MVEHIIKNVIEDSIGEEMGIEPGDILLEVNGHKIEDVFDYQYLTYDENVILLVKKPSGEEWELEIDKDENEDIGLEFTEGLMDDYRSCTNNCIFCFIDQMPKGMRDTLYFKDDDSRLSFLSGNYITLTNMKDKDIDRIIKFHMEPINISFHTTNPELRNQMLHNRFAGEALKKVDKLYDAGITMNGQIVLVKGVNDGEELERSINDLGRYFPYLQSVSIVPVGITKFREGLYPINPFTKEDAIKIIETVTKFQDEFHEKNGSHFVFLGDEWYSLASMDLPREDRYDGYLQIENGVGMMRSFLDEAFSYISKLDGKEEDEIESNLLKQEEVIDKIEKDNDSLNTLNLKEKKIISLGTGYLAYPYIKKVTDAIEELYPHLQIKVYPIKNEFFGETITVSGLITGKDLITQLKDKDLGERLLLPINMFRFGEEVLLDDISKDDIIKTLNVDVKIVEANGELFVRSILDSSTF
ncbi:MAG: DUF512 domain-containing protein [Lachnospiraceae bacterium]|jgi:putative radical SAM enzyme (TIGR03279 family)|nr:DUF512 domain-containing protein [Lachnospiraceae bacterium]